MDAAPAATVFSLTPAQNFTLDRVELAGNYALQLHWSDGHNSGIYSWEYLRELQPPES
jgi:DUF971 family protein